MGSEQKCSGLLISAYCLKLFPNESLSTEVGELGDILSGGEKQRIGIAGAFLHDSLFLLMDKPMSNLDSLNKGIILKSLRESAEERKPTVSAVFFALEPNRIILFAPYILHQYIISDKTWSTHIKYSDPFYVACEQYPFYIIKKDSITGILSCSRSDRI